eukprot:7583094-Alexandrium_andersonii.AAC.1
MQCHSARCQTPAPEPSDSPWRAHAMHHGLEAALRSVFERMAKGKWHSRAELARPGGTVALGDP